MDLLIKSALIDFLKKHQNTFAESIDNMMVINLEVITHIS